MLILVHTAHPQAVEHAGPGFGRLLSPRDYSRARDTGAAGIPWAADNDAFNDFHPHRYAQMLMTLRGAPGCLFVTLPDVVADWQQTRHLADQWLASLHDLPVAYVAQDGQPEALVPWESIDCLFLGGTTSFKLSADAQRLGREAKDKGKWLHMGRVNSRKRFDYARAIHCDSVDGSSFSKWRETYVPEALEWHKEPFQMVTET